MTAVASPPSVQSGPRLGWYPTGNGGQGTLTSMSADEVSQILMPRKTVQRSNSSSSLSSTSSTSTVVGPPQQSDAGQGLGNDSGNAGARKKTPKHIWSSSKSKPISGVTNIRPQPVSAPPPGGSASSAMSALHQPPPMLPSQQVAPPPQQNGVRTSNRFPSEPTAVLSLLPINGTFDRKQINLPYFPEVLRIGRQTNAKTIPTPSNGYFDSKVLSRSHAEVWADRAGKIWIRDVKSSNGTFVNGQRLSGENRDSEPHELREQDLLELGIDIVSEDQKSIVHHKVSARVEHAGVYGPNMNILDLNFGDIDPTTGGGLMPHHLSQPLSHMRGRVGSSSNGSARSNPDAMGAQVGWLNWQRQMNYWTSPVSVEQVVKNLMSEMKQAQQQHSDLGLATGFLSNLTTQEKSPKERLNSIPTDVSASTRPTGARSKLIKSDSMSRFSDPPAPPPQQPLPEKPSGPRRIFSTDSLSKAAFKRVETERPSQKEMSSSFIALRDAFNATKKELDLQSSRVKDLEMQLRQEQAARNDAELRIEAMRSKNPLFQRTAIDKFVRDELEKNGSKKSDEVVNNTEADPPVETAAESVDPVLSELPSPSPSTEHTTDELKLRIESLIAEMDGMKKQMEIYKESSERAEGEATETRRTLAEMVESIRREREETAKSALSPPKEESETVDPVTKSIDDKAEDCPEDIEAIIQCCRPINHARLKELESAATAFARERSKTSALEHSAPYASMLGIVLIGVGIMACLNGWHKVDR
ncbi:hypothetical protein FQN57_001711 [Myotisia sp. PD_48]|nr:hypothetical protein FQN57_001711 [Myotisia sp. PD_48]